VEADEAGDQLQDEELVFEGELVLCVLQVLLKELFGEALGIVDEVQGGEVQGVRRMLLALLPVLGQPQLQTAGGVSLPFDLVNSLLISFLSLLALLVDGALVLDLLQVDLLVTVLILHLLALLVAT